MVPDQKCLEMLDQVDIGAPIGILSAERPCLGAWTVTRHRRASPGVICNGVIWCAAGLSTAGLTEVSCVKVVVQSRASDPKPGLYLNEAEVPRGNKQ
jgi:hypothetical protein